MKTRTIVGLSVPLIATGALAATAEQFYQFAFKRIDYIPNAGATMLKYAPDYYNDVNWVKMRPDLTVWHQQAPDGERLSALWVPRRGSNKVVVIGHGYKGTGITMSNYARMFHQMGFNVLMPDDRGHGGSGSDYISFGWLDRLDYLRWIDQIIAHMVQNAAILLFGTSMGGATVSLVSGEKHLQPQVKAVIEDCGYSSLDGEFAYILKNVFHLPRRPIVPLASLINYRRLGYFFKAVDVSGALRRSRLPLLVIHGAEDTYVPTFMGRENFDAAGGPKQLWLVPDAGHAESYWVNPDQYQNHIASFLDTHFRY